jgi:hypothetical protein
MGATLSATQSTSADPEGSEDRLIFERASRRYLGMSTEEFVEKCKSGFFADRPDFAYRAAKVALLLPLLSAK